MKKIILPVIAFSTLVMSVSSCSKKCQVCDFKPTRGEVELCPKDFPDGASGLRLSIQAYEDAGYTCTEK